MTEHGPMKVYELAKEVGIDSISLVGKLKDFGISVKSHMSELSAEQVSQAKDGLSPKDAKKTKAKAKAKTKTKAKRKTSAKKTTTKSTSTAAKAVTKTRKKVATPAAETTEVDDENGASKAPSRRMIIRRRTGDGAAIETTATIETTTAVEETETVASAAEQTVEVIQTTEAAPETLTAAAETASTQEEVIVVKKETPAAAQPAPPVIRKREKTSFLKVVAPEKPKTPKIEKPKETPAKDSDRNSTRFTKFNKEALDKMFEEESAKKKKTAGPRSPDRRGGAQDVRVGDYRKKEMFFLPKRKVIPEGREMSKTQITKPKASKRIIEVDETISVQDLADSLKIKPVQLIKKLMGMGQMATVNQSLDFDTASLVAGEFDYEVRNITFKEETIIETLEDSESDLAGRPPIVTVMGHVDHGKTSLLDAIRSTNVVDGEAGGITQHVGAYTVVKDGQKITFIDTPGHEAFTEMRARGANATDIVILVVAADDGAMPQTREAISHAQAANVPIIVAVNKIDKPGAQPEKIKQTLSELNLLAEDWGGDTMFIPVSATERTNIDKLLEAINLQAEILELKANPKAPASGTVVEAQLEKGRGPVVSMIVTRGTLKRGDYVVCGSFVGKVRAMVDDKRRPIKEVEPGMAAEVLGFEGVPNAGERFDVVKSDGDARRVVSHRSAAANTSTSSGPVALDQLFAKMGEGNTKELNIIIKADVFGSSEAVKSSLEKLSSEQVKVNVIHCASGGVTESDVHLASASGAIVIGFNVRPDTKARQLAESKHIEIKNYTIIYELLEDVKKAMAGVLDKKEVEKFLGRAEVRQTFSVPKIGVIAGTSVVDGKMVRGSNVRLLRDSKVVFEGKMSSLKRFKDDAKEVQSGYECGIGIENYNDMKPGDIIEAFEIELITPELEV